MIYLLDVNVLVALRYTTHAHHSRATCWSDGFDSRHPSDRFATCSVTEIGFVRIACSKRVNLAKTIGAAREDLARLKEDRLTMFLGDPLGADHLPDWVTRSAHVTDGHLLSLAKGWGGQLVTLDAGIPGAILIPKQADGPMTIREPTIPYRVGARYASRLN
jgi:predicted nucleic acid-binding protein